MKFLSTKLIPLGSCAFRQWRADSHCSFIHGYRLQSKIWFQADELDDKNWVFDFGGLKELKQLLEKQFDHTTCIAGDDPELEIFKLLHNKHIIDLRIMEDGVGIEKTAQFVYNLADKYVREKSDNRVTVLKVEVWEHEGNSAIYENIPTQQTTVNKPEVTVRKLHNDQNEQTQAVPRTIVKSTGNPFHNIFEGTSWG
jgi:6-pyruvoyltetrahydropterin/6-carboxytetrahydropterin synthase